MPAPRTLPTGTGETVVAPTEPALTTAE